MDQVIGDQVIWDQAIWVEILSRQRELKARVRVAGPLVRIGRGYDNEVIVDDPYVAAQHIRVFRDEAGKLVAEDAGSRNGMFLDWDTSPARRIVIDGERPIRIGHTYLRIREAGHAVPPERVGKPEGRSAPIALLAVLGGVLIGIEALHLWLVETGEPRLSSYLVWLLAIAGGVVGWALGWALVSRTFSGWARFERNLLIALLGALAYSLYNEMAAFSAFALTWASPTTYAYAAMWCILAAVSFFHLREAGPSRLKLKGGVVAALLILAIATQTLSRSEARTEFGGQTTLHLLKPPAFRLTPVQDAKAFFGEIERLKASLDRDREEPR